MLRKNQRQTSNNEDKEIDEGHRYKVFTNIRKYKIT